MMDREILFRAKRIDNGEWVQGDLIHEPYGMVVQYYDDEIEDKGNCAKRGSKKRIKATIDSATICQYTGSTDKNGRKIFEGDIINDIDYGIMKCIYLHGSFMWYKEDGFKIECLKYVPAIEIIGNIFDNPELVKN